MTPHNATAVIVLFGMVKLAILCSPSFEGL